MSTAAPERVAVVTVHGVADQQAGQTVRELARLLCHGAEGPPRYGAGEARDVLVPVEPLAPQAPPAVPSGEGSVREPRAARLPRPGAPSGFYSSEAATGAQPAARAVDAPDDLGLALTDYLLARYQPAERDALYESTRISLTRHADGRAVDLYELYWADYSRLQPGGVRALTATYQLLFHLSTLARDVVDQIVLGGTARGAPFAWSSMQKLHAWSAWLLRAPAALVQMSMLLLFVFGIAAIVPHEQKYLLLSAAAGAATVALGAAALLGWLRPPDGARRSQALLLGAAALACAGVAIGALLIDEGFAFRWLYFSACALGTGVLGLALVWRFARLARDVKALGALVMVAMVALLFWWGWRLPGNLIPLSGWMLTAALHAGEYLLAALLFAWGLLVCTQVAALALGFVLARGGSVPVRDSIVTARLGMIISTALFALLSLLLWSVLSYLAGLALDDVDFSPALFGPSPPSAEAFLEMQVKQVGTLFLPLVVCAAVLGGVALFALAPCLREEIAPTVNLAHGRPAAGLAQWSGRLGGWLSRSQRLLESVFSWIVPLLAITGGILYLAFALQRFFDELDIGRWLEAFPGEPLVAAGKWLAGGAVTITALGARFTQTIGKLRVALDAALDVDNYFRDPLDRRPPRARIFSRYVALLAHLRSRGYARIVIVSHSQGTVISADLLRYLHRGGRLGELLGPVGVALVTLGSPLRDLYARRFPLLYQWVGAQPSFDRATPGVDELGIEQWVNAYRAGDYVGRAIWTPLADTDAFAIATVGADGVVQARRAAGRVEFCLGAGAHTHYFSNDAASLATEIDRLVVAGDRAPLR